MVSFVHQLDWTTGCLYIWSNVILDVFIRMFLWRSTFDLIDWGKHIVFPIVGGPHPIERRCWVRRSSFCLSWIVGLFLSLDLNWNICSSWVADLLAFRLKFILLSLLIHRLWKWDYKYTTSNSGSPTSWLQILWFLSFHNHLSQFQLNKQTNK